MVFKINGGNRLCGSLKIESAKNSVLPIMAGAVLTDKEVIIENCPKISDVFAMSDILRSVGKIVKFCGENLTITPDEGFVGGDLNFSTDLASSVRTSVLMLGALSAKTKKAKIPYPGGCDFGGRPIDIHINALKMLGAKIAEEDDRIVCGSPIKGGKAVLPFPSVGATENVILACVLGKGDSVIVNAAREPEIVDLAAFLNRLGAKIYGAGTSVIRVEGVKNLNGGTIRPSPDRIEAGTYLVAAAVTGGEIELNNVNAENISSLLGKLCDNTCKFKIKNDIIYLHSGKRKKAFDLTTGPYPLFPTDLQAQASVLAAVSDGRSKIKDEVFKNRFAHVVELKKMGAKVSVHGNLATFDGVPVLHGAEVCAHDLRCGAALVLAGLNAEGTTVVHDVKFLERGYYAMDKKLAALGADIVRA
ncbi:MAG: UDP-N-acetylglucosamine 1-carboxyvinyltransferase [Clostridia bacterium]|nr:UDP-N-acetylglucosamine 1-carboxyvinyltransferase [Clostridia bacterium]